MKFQHTMPDCDCGLWSGKPCVITRWKTTVVYFLPPSHREGRTVDDRGDFPKNGELRLRVAPECAARMVAAEGDWVEVVA